MQSLRLTALSRAYNQRLIVGLYALINPGTAIGVMAALARPAVFHSRHPLATHDPDVAVVLLTMQGFVINRLAGLPYPYWAPRADPALQGGGTTTRPESP